MHMYKISVIIPVYNAEKTLPDTLKSTAAQSLSDIEIICVDDGSTDGSVEIIQSFIKLAGRSFEYPLCQTAKWRCRQRKKQRYGYGSGRIYCIHGCG